MRLFFVDRGIIATPLLAFPVAELLLWLKAAFTTNLVVADVAGKAVVEVLHVLLLLIPGHLDLIDSNRRHVRECSLGELSVGA